MQSMGRRWAIRSFVLLEILVFHVISNFYSEISYLVVGNYLLQSKDGAVSFRCQDFIPGTFSCSFIKMSCPARKSNFARHGEPYRLVISIPSVF